MQAHKSNGVVGLVVVVFMLWGAQECFAHGPAKGHRVAPAKSKVEIASDVLLRVTCTIYAEAKGETDQGKRAVASVIYTRAGSLMLKKHCTWERALEDTCKAGAFSCWNRGWPQSPNMKKSAERDAWYASYNLASELLNKTFTPDIQSRYYHEASIKPYWSRGMKLLCQIDNHKFYR